jgi:hypothetical protein
MTWSKPIGSGADIRNWMRFSCRAVANAPRVADKKIGTSSSNGVDGEAGGMGSTGKWHAGSGGTDGEAGRVEPTGEWRPGVSGLLGVACRLGWAEGEAGGLDRRGSGVPA